MKNKNLQKILSEIGEEYVDELTRLIIKEKKIDTGNLLASLDYRVVQAVDGVILEILANETLTYIDQGRKKNSKQPPISAIIPWVQRKNIKIKGAKKPEQSAFVIARAIGKNGIAPTNIVKQARDKVLLNKIELIKKASEEDINIMLKEIFNN